MKKSEIGMTSNFTNSSGINDPDNVSTVRDIAIMSKYLIINILNIMSSSRKNVYMG